MRVALSFGISKSRNKNLQTEQEIEEENFILFTDRPSRTLPFATAWHFI